MENTIIRLNGIFDMRKTHKLLKDLNGNFSRHGNCSEGTLKNVTVHIPAYLMKTIGSQHASDQLAFGLHHFVSEVIFF